jgi:hypothetical protein
MGFCASKEHTGASGLEWTSDGGRWREILRFGLCEGFGWRRWWLMFALVFLVLLGGG